MLRSNYDLKRQQQLQQYKNQIHTDKAVKRILIISPDDDVNLALKTALEQVEGDATSSVSVGYDFKADCFNNPALALKNFKSGLYDLLIVDVIMPQINGFDLAEDIKNIDQNVRVCFLIAGEVPGKLRANQFRVRGDGRYEDKFIQIPIENNNLLRQVAVVIDS